MRSTEQMKILEILRLYELDQLTYEQIGQHAGVGKSTVGDVIKRCKQAMGEPDEQRKTALTEALYKETISSWDNILRLEGRRLRSFSTPFGMMKERYDIQAAFPVIMKEWIVAVEEV